MFGNVALPCLQHSQIQESCCEREEVGAQWPPGGSLAQMAVEVHSTSISDPYSQTRNFTDLATPRQSRHVNVVDPGESLRKEAGEDGASSLLISPWLNSLLKKQWEEGTMLLLNSVPP